MPVYVLFTKADLIAGFTDSSTISIASSERRSGVSRFERRPTRETVAGSFAGELHALVERLNERLFDRLQAERNPERCSRIAMFPARSPASSRPDGVPPGRARRTRSVHARRCCAAST